jgi:uracil-DNA glycosylase family 4
MCYDATVKAKGPGATSLDALRADIVACRACPRLVAWREEVARVKVARFRDCNYWGRPVPGFGDPAARIAIVGLAPGAHGANRTGRVFTGDRSGAFLFAAMHRAGLASQPTSVSIDDGLTLRDAYITAVARCVPPDNRPLPDEIARCAVFLDREIALLPRARVLLALGAIAWQACISHLARRGIPVPRPRPAFAHGASWEADRRAGGPVVIGSFHVSQQNTQTGKLTPEMLDDVLATAKATAKTRGPASRAPSGFAWPQGT